METVVIHTSLCIVVMTANIILLVLSRKVRGLGSQLSSFVILQLAFWDSVHSGVVISSNLLRIGNIAANNTAPIDSHQCLYYPCYDLFILTYQMVPYAIVMVSIERFLAAWCPITYQNMTVRRHFQIGVVVACFALLNTIILVFLNSQSPSKRVTPMCYFSTYMDAWVSDSLTTFRMGTTLLSIIIYIPVFLKIFMIVTSSKQQTTAVRRLMRTSIIFSLLFWGSIFLAIIPDALVAFTEFGLRNQPIMYLLNAMKCILNVIVISLLHKDVNQAFLKLFGCQKKKNVNVQRVTVMSVALQSSVAHHSVSR